MLRILIDTGMRAAELINLKVSALDLDLGVAIVMGTGRRPRSCAFAAKTATSIDRCLRQRAKHAQGSGDWLGLGRRGRVTYAGLRQMLERRAGLAGIGHIHVQQLRHSFAHAYLSQAGSGGDLMQLAGWRSRAMLDRYAASTAGERAREAYKRMGIGTDCDRSLRPPLAQRRGSRTNARDAGHPPPRSRSARCPVATPESLRGTSLTVVSRARPRGSASSPAPKCQVKSSGKPGPLAGIGAADAVGRRPGREQPLVVRTGWLGCGLVRVSLLGPLLVLDGDGAELVVTAPKERAVLAWLALSAGTTVRSAELMNGLWGDDPPLTAAKTLQNYVAALRRVLPAGAIETVPGGYRLAVGSDDIDVGSYQRLAREGALAMGAGDVVLAADRLSAALKLWRGEALADVVDRPAGMAEAARLGESRRSIEEQLFDARLSLGEHAVMVADLDAAVATEPLREKRWAQLMLALYRCGRQADTLPRLPTAAGRTRR